MSSAVELLICESKNLTFGSLITILSPHLLFHFLKYKGLQTLPPPKFSPFK